MRQGISQADVDAFCEEVWGFSKKGRRSMPWREDTSFYSVLVSEMMLQQTQVERVKPKYAAFMQRFPSIEKLATAPLSEVIIHWQGLGYNRRAKYLHDSAKFVAAHGVPKTIDELIQLPGIGRNSAGAIVAYVYNQPSLFIETNIRTVYIHRFFHDEEGVDDGQLMELLKRTIDKEHPREWYYALMDYGSYLKKIVSNNGQSRHYKMQSRLEGSLRQMRGKIVDRLRHGTVDKKSLIDHFDNDERVHPALDGLIRDGLVVVRESRVSLTGSDNQS